ncbi:unnamed protein product [Ambrosiozyma monospora]|uniref:Unnamed protein product n=1 Tax=Ambrosiozyma monospora TaxID=43982 RepID=A0ACB5UBT5_AMBMO|nr:unnamed protein product [Ambrosiozyma monospora]
MSLLKTQGAAAAVEDAEGDDDDSDEEYDSSFESKNIGVKVIKRIVRDPVVNVWTTTCSTVGPLSFVLSITLGIKDTLDLDDSLTDIPITFEWPIGAGVNQSGIRENFGDFEISSMEVSLDTTVDFKFEDMSNDNKGPTKLQKKFSVPLVKEKFTEGRPTVRISDLVFDEETSVFKLETKLSRFITRTTLFDKIGHTVLETRPKTVRSPLETSTSAGTQSL